MLELIVRRSGLFQVEQEHISAFLIAKYQGCFCSTVDSREDAV
jgi:hypothetical protein